MSLVVKYECFIKQKEDWEKNRLSPPEILVSSFILHDFHLEKFLQAYQHLIRRHESLRTVFVKDSDGVWQHVLDGTPKEGFIVNLLKNSKKTYSHNIFREVLSQKFEDLSQSPLCRVYVQLKGEREAIIFIVLHHIIGDDWSMNVLERDFKFAYRSVAGGFSNPFPESHHQLKDYAIKRNAEFENKKDRFLTYWRSKLQPELLNELIARNHQRAVVQEYGNRVLSNTGVQADAVLNALSEKNRSMVMSDYLDMDLAEQLKISSINLKASTFTLLASAFALALSLSEDLKYVLFSTVCADRFKPENQSLIGHLIGDVFIKYRIDMRTSLETFIGQNQQEFIRSMRHIIFNYEPLNDLPLIAASVIHLNYVVDSSSCEIELERGHRALVSLFYPLTISLLKTAKTVSYQVYYHLNFYSTSEIDYLNESFKELLQVIIQEPQKVIGDIRLNQSQTF